MINKLGYFETVDNLCKCFVGSECLPRSVAESTAIDSLCHGLFIICVDRIISLTSFVELSKKIDLT